jgi:hypothetical protein
MAAKTKHRIIDELLDVRMVLDSSSPSRLLSIGNDWSKLRIAMRIRMQDTGANIVGTPRFTVGVCSGTAAPWNNGSAPTTHFVGAITAGSSWNRAAGPPAYYPTGGNASAKRVGTTLTTGSAAWQQIIFADPDAAANSLYFVDVIKGSPNFSIRVLSQTLATAVTPSLDNLLGTAIIETPSFAQHAYSTAQTIAVDEADGALNAVNLAWDRPNGLIEISDLVIVRFA